MLALITIDNELVDKDELVEIVNGRAAVAEHASTLLRHCIGNRGMLVEREERPHQRLRSYLVEVAQTARCGANDR